MLFATDQLSDALREEERVAIPWRADAAGLNRTLIGALSAKGVDLIDLAVGTHHARAALVALQEGVDLLVQVGLELGESVVAERFFADRVVIDPLEARPADDATRFKLRIRMARMPVESAAIRLVSAGHHLVNAHLRFAWEANAARADELTLCHFDPNNQGHPQWASIADLERGLDSLSTRSLAVFPGFCCNRAFATWVATPEFAATRTLRDELIHRERPSYREAPSFGRSSLWRSKPFKVTIPAPSYEDAGAPSVSERRAAIRAAGGATVAYAEALWRNLKRWLRTVDVSIVQEPGQVRVNVQIRPGQTEPRIPRERRDPGPFLISGRV